MNESLQHFSDAQVIAESFGSPEVFACLFDRHYAVIHRFAARRLGPEKADDLAAETFIRAFSARESYNQTLADARPWLFGIASNLIRMHARSEERRLRAYARVSPEVEEDFADLAIGRASAQSIGESVSSAIAMLRTGDREVLLLHAWADLSPTEIAASLGLSDGTVRSRLSRARKRIRKALDAKDFEPSFYLSEEVQ